LDTDVATLPQTAAAGELIINPKRLEIMAHNRKIIKSLIMNTLIPDHDYGTIDGCGDKPMLFQPGNQKIMSLANVYPDPTSIEKELGNGHREYVVKTFLKQLGSDMPVATGMGSCSTMESKYRYRNAEPIDTGAQLPNGYWNKKDPKERRKMLMPGTIAKKNAEGKWTVHRLTGEKVENPDLADQYNTILKMAVKRSIANAVANMMGGWGEQFLEEDAPQDQPPIDSGAPEPTSEDELNRMRAEFSKWPQNKKDAYDRKHAELVDTGVEKNDAVRQAYDHVIKYFQ